MPGCCTGLSQISKSGRSDGPAMATTMGCGWNLIKINAGKALEVQAKGPWGSYDVHLLLLAHPDSSSLNGAYGLPDKVPHRGEAMQASQSGAALASRKRREELNPENSAQCGGNSSCLP